MVYLKHMNGIKHMTNSDLKKRIFDISFHHHLAHIGSCLTAVDIIEEIYQKKKPEEQFVLSSGHAALALYCVIEKHGGKNAEDIFKHHGVHPDRCSDCSIFVSTGSLGNGLPIAVGMALADRTKNVYCLISDGECAEGSIHEAARIASQYTLDNLHVYLNDNGWAAYQPTNTYRFPLFTSGEFIHVKTNSEQIPCLKGQEAHYHVMNEHEYREALEVCV